LKNKVLLLGFILAFVGLGQAPDALVTKCLPAFYKLESPEQDSSVELEMTTNPAILSLMTTPSGKLKDFFPESFIPDRVASRIAGKSPEQIKEMFWHELTYSEKMAVLTAISEQKRTSFFQDRKIPVVRYVDELPLMVPDRTEFLGRTLERGEQVLHLPEFLRGAIEYMGPQNDPGGVELHFRLNQPAGEVSRSARIFQHVLRVPPTHQHVYVVTPIPQARLESSPRLTALEHADFFRRANLAAEMISIVEEGKSITKNQKRINGQEVVFFSWLEAYKLIEVASYLEARGKHEDFDLGDSIKMGWVGFRGHDKFDKPDLMGMEVRSIGRESDMIEMERFLNALQRTWASSDLGISREKMETWLNENYGGRLETALVQNWYHRDWSQLLTTAAPEVQAEIARWSTAERALFISRAPEELKMLVHDWSQDPVLIDNPKKQKEVQREQLSAIQRLRTGFVQPPEAVRSFLIRSGLYEVVLRSLVSKTKELPH